MVPFFVCTNDTIAQDRRPLTVGIDGMVNKYCNSAASMVYHHMYVCNYTSRVGGTAGDNEPSVCDEPTLRALLYNNLHTHLIMYKSKHENV